MMDGVCRLSLMYCLSVGLACLAGWRYLSTDKAREKEREREKKKSYDRGAHAKSAWQNTVVIRCEDDGVVVPVSLYVVVRVRVAD